MALAAVAWGVYNLFGRPSDPKQPHVLGGCLVPISAELRPLFPFVNRNGEIEGEACLDKWSLVHFVLYMLTGLAFPHEYGVAAAFSVACEAFEYVAKFRAKLSDVAVNMAGYALGSALHRHHSVRLAPTPTRQSMCATGLVLAGTMLALFTHRRRTLPAVSRMSTTEEFPNAGVVSIGVGK